MVKTNHHTATWRLSIQLPLTIKYMESSSRPRGFSSLSDWKLITKISLIIGITDGWCEEVRSVLSPRRLDHK